MGGPSLSRNKLKVHGIRIKLGSLQIKSLFKVFLKTSSKRRWNVVQSDRRRAHFRRPVLRDALRRQDLRRRQEVLQANPETETPEPESGRTGKSGWTCRKFQAIQKLIRSELSRGLARTLYDWEELGLYQVKPTICAARICCCNLCNKGCLENSFTAYKWSSAIDWYGKNTWFVGLFDAIFQRKFYWKTYLCKSVQMNCRWTVTRHSENAVAL